MLGMLKVLYLEVRPKDKIIWIAYFTISQTSKISKDYLGDIPQLNFDKPGHFKRTYFI